MTELVHAISHRVAGFLEREGILERDEESSYLNLEKGDEDPMQQVLGRLRFYIRPDIQAVSPDGPDGIR